MAASWRACSPGIRCSNSHAVHVSVCFLLMGNSGIQNSVALVVSLRSRDALRVRDLFDALARQSRGFSSRANATPTASVVFATAA